MREEVCFCLLKFIQRVSLGLFATLFRLLIQEIKRSEYLFHYKTCENVYKVNFSYLRYKQKGKSPFLPISSPELALSQLSASLIPP